MSKRSLCCGRMRAGVHSHRAHESRQCAARCISCHMTSWRAAKYSRAESPAHTPTEGEERAAAPQWSPAQQCARRQVALRKPQCLAQDLGSFP